MVNEIRVIQRILQSISNLHLNKHGFQRIQIGKNNNKKDTIPCGSGSVYTVYINYRT
jgi:hypothetical protein